MSGEGNLLVVESLKCGGRSFDLFIFDLFFGWKKNGVEWYEQFS